MMIRPDSCSVREGDPPEDPPQGSGGVADQRQRRRPERDLLNDTWGALERGKRSLPQLKLGSTWKQNNILEIRQTLEDWLNKCTFSIATWRHGAQSYWLHEVVAEARERHKSWLKSSPEARAAIEPEFILGDRNCIPDAMNVVESCLRVELFEAIPKQFADRLCQKRILYSDVDNSVCVSSRWYSQMTSVKCPCRKSF